MNITNLKRSVLSASALLLALLAGPAVRADYSNTVMSFNPVAYWRLDETNTVPLPDVTFNQGTLGAAANGFYGGATTRAVTGALAGDSDTAVHLNYDNSGNAGTAGWVEAVHTAVAGATVFSVEAWVKPDYTSTLHSDLNDSFACPLSCVQFSTSRLGWLIYQNSSSAWSVRAYKNSGSATLGTLDGGGPITVGTWYHLVFVKDSTTASLYVNGNRVANVSASGYAPAAASTPFDVGRRSGGNYPYPGTVDEVAFYASALSAGDVLAHYQNGTNSSRSTPYSTLVLAQNPILYYRLNEPVYNPGTLPVAVNSGTAGANANGTYQPGSTAGVPGVPFTGMGANNYACQFNGRVGYIDFGQPAELSISGPITLSAWVKVNAFNNNWQAIVNKGDSSWRLHRSSSGNNLAFSTTQPGGASDDLAGSRNVNDGQWHQVVGVYDGSATKYLYVDGVLDGTDSWAGPLNLNTFKVYIGENSERPGKVWNGLIDEVAVFTSAFTADQVQQLYYSAEVGPRIVQQPQGPANGTANQGDPLTLSVTAVGTPTLYYQWTKDGVNLAGQNATNLVFSSLQLTDSGSYAVIVTNAYGAVTSSVVSFTVIARPVILQPPQPATRYVGSTVSFSVTAGGGMPLSYQWQLNGADIAGAVASSYTVANVQLASAGNYSCTITNIYGSTNSPGAVLTVLPAPIGGYASTVLADNPLAYWRLGETSGTVAYDYWNGHDGQYVNVALGRPGFSVMDPDTAGGFGPAINSYVGSISGIDFAAPANTTSFSLEAWVNGPASQVAGAAIIAKGTGSGGEQFDLDLYSGSKYRFFVRDALGATSGVNVSVGPNGTWQHVVAVYDGPNGVLYLYVNGQMVGYAAVSLNGILASSHPVTIGSRQSGSGPYDFNFNGSIDEVAVYNVALSQDRVLAHYNAHHVWPNTPPVVVQAPQPVTVYAGRPATFSVVAGGSVPFSYQWNFGGNPITGANDSTYTIYSAQASDMGNYNCTIVNTYGSTNSPSAALTVLSTSGYVGAVLADNPIAYWRLNETSGTVAHDYWGGYGAQFTNTILGLPGYCFNDPDAAIGLQPVSNGSYAWVADNSPFNFSGGIPTFTLEAWVNFTNVNGIQRVFSTGIPNGYGFGINGANMLRFTAFGVKDYDQTLPAPLVPGVWYHLVGVANGGSFTFYVNGQSINTVYLQGAGIRSSSQPFLLGRLVTGNPSVPEQLNGRLDEVAVYSSALSAYQVQTHYAARYGSTTPPLIRLQPMMAFPTNYVGASDTLMVAAEGTEPLSYQWQRNGVDVSGANSSMLTLSPLQLSDAGSYSVAITNAVGATNSASTQLTVLPIPTSASGLNLTQGLVLHLTFDDNYLDYSGRGNNGTPVGVVSFVPGMVGSSALHYYTDTGANSYNYVRLGLLPDLQFGSSVNFSVAYWVRLPAGFASGDLPFLCDAVTSTWAPGFTFAPHYYAGGWVWSLNGTGGYGPDNGINDGNWHHLVHTFDRATVGITYLDGVQVDSQAIGGVGNIDNGQPANIGQDPTGAYAESGAADLDDLGVWRRVLTPLEVTGMYLASVSNSVSFAPPVAKITMQPVGSQFQLTWPMGTLQSADQVEGPYSDVTGATSPYQVTPTAAKKFYRVRF